ncbi:MAG: LysR substrate-binding domain-containing protein [Polaromonas sp.]|nr:LysR substrate-binding domain-containing protein [Burkholderiaceae bacterium]MDP1568057.1 LysR substrate-binding domain-containing protein [Polaromonas sp.]MDP3170802.1 LysR substrate-binding domain-containing protein [Polaromonas sp.]
MEHLLPKAQNPGTRYDLTDLRVFLAVADAGNISRGGALCNLAPSTTSLRILHLEETLGVTLFTRKSRGVLITQPGLILLEHARRCLANLKQAHADLAPFVGGHRAQLVVMANSNAMASYLPSDLQSFLVEHPGIRVALAERTSSEIATAVATGRADLGIGVWDPQHQALEFTPYKTDELVLIVPNSHPLASKAGVRFSGCAKEPFVCLQSDSAIHIFMVKLAHDLGHRLDVRVQVSGFGTVAGLVAAGVGIGIIPRSIFLDAGKDCQAIRLDEPWAARRLSVCVRRDIGAGTPTDLLRRHLSRQRER